MFVKYTASTPIQIEVRGHTKRFNKVIVVMTMGSVSGVYTSFMEVENPAKTMTTYIVATTRTITATSWSTWSVSSYPAQFLMIGMGSIGIGISDYYVSSSYYCKIAIWNPSASTYRTCYVCRPNYYLSGNNCYSCSSTVANCLYFTDCKCEQCKNGWLLKNGTCVSKPSLNSNCLEYQQVGKCAKCTLGMSPNGNYLWDTCSKCPTIENCDIYLLFSC